MTDTPLQSPSDEELDAFSRRVAKLLDEMEQIPESEQRRLDSGKFTGPFAETILNGSGLATDIV